MWLELLIVAGIVIYCVWSEHRHDFDEMDKWLVAYRRRIRESERNHGRS
jgi:hypothetical protein